MHHFAHNLLSLSRTLTRGAYRRGRSIALALLTSASLLLGVTPAVCEALEAAADSSCECESGECLVVCLNPVHHRRDTLQGWTVRLASHGGNATRAGQRMTAAPLSGHRLANGLSAPIRC